MEIKDRPSEVDPPLLDRYVQPYGNLSELNTHRLILDTIGEDNLMALVNTYLDLLGTSAAVYEQNGDYALGIFASRWCRFMDQASRNLCGTSSNLEAMKSCRWHCHESCFRISQEAMQEGRPVDRECLGGIRIFAVPILAGGEVIGAMNFGYGSPPTEPQTIRKLAERYEVPEEELWFQAEAYVPRDPFVIELAKNNLHTAAQLLGEIILHKRLGPKPLVPGPEEEELEAPAPPRPLAKDPVQEIRANLFALTGRTLGVDCIEILEYQEDQKQFLYIDGVGWRNRVARETVFPDSETHPAGLALRTGQDQLIEDLPSPKGGEEAGSLASEGVRCGLTVLIQGRGAPYGVLGVHHRSPREFSNQDSKFIQEVAQILGWAILIEQENRALVRENEGLHYVNQVLRSLLKNTAGELWSALEKIKVFNDEVWRLVKENPIPRARNHVERIAALIRRMETLLENRAVFSRLRGQAEHHLQVDLNKVLQEAQVNLEPLVTESGVQMEVRSLPRIQGNPYLLQRLFTQLLEVLLKEAKPPRGSRLRVANGPLTIPDWEILVEFHPATGTEPLPLEPEYFKHLLLALQDCQNLMALQRGRMIVDTLDEGGLLISLHFPKE